MTEKLRIALVTPDPFVVDACTAALATLTTPGTAPPPPDLPAPLALVRRQAAAFAAGLERPVAMELVHGPTEEIVQERLAAGADGARLGLCIVDARACLVAAHQPGDAQPVFDRLYASLPPGGGLRSGLSDNLLIPVEDYESEPYQNTLRYRVRVLPEKAWLLEAELTALVTNYLHHVFTNRFAHRRLRSTEARVPLGIHLAEYMQLRFEHEWVLSYYTGSVVSSLIKTLDGIATERGVLVHRGPSEHALACASFINWRLYQRGFLMVLTSAMVDELKGTLANLQQVGAKGIILCADAPETKWFGFQATVGSDADVRRVLEARRIPYVYLDDPERTGEGLEQIAAALDEGDGPVVVIATQPVLEARTALAQPPCFAPSPPARVTVGPPPDLRRALDVINTEPAHLLWQCGALTPRERDLTLGIAEQAGIALCDALSAPGFLPAYRDGQRVPNYLGVLGQYGTNQEVFEFLNTGGKPNPPAEQWLFVLKGKLGQIDSPYSDGDHARSFRIGQVNQRAEHIGPFADLRLTMPVAAFLEAVAVGLEVRPDVRRHREAKLAALRRDIPDVFGELPTLPMTPNYFFASLRKVVEQLITTRGYRYEGVFDVGHCGTLGVRWLPRTDPGYSGWYGRGLMGDALHSAAALVTTGRNNVLAVVGDGAKQITADILPGIVENLMARGRPTGKNVTIFFLLNNLFSVINTYQERLLFQDGGRQMEVVNPEAFVEPDTCAMVAGTRVLRQRLLHFDAEAIGEALAVPNRVNLFSVPVVSNSDGISIADQQNWQYAAPAVAR